MYKLDRKGRFLAQRGNGGQDDLHVHPLVPFIEIVATEYALDLHAPQCGQLCGQNRSLQFTDSMVCGFFLASPHILELEGKYPIRRLELWEHFLQAVAVDLEMFDGGELVDVKLSAASYIYL